MIYEILVEKMCIETLYCRKVFSCGKITKFFKWKVVNKSIDYNHYVTSHAHVYTIRKKPAKFQNVSRKAVEGVAHIRYVL